MVPESNPDSKFIYYAKKLKVKRQKKTETKKYNPNTRKHEFLLKNFYIRNDIFF